LIFDAQPWSFSPAVGIFNLPYAVTSSYRFNPQSREFMAVQLQPKLNLGHPALSFGESEIAVGAFEAALQLNGRSESASRGLRAARGKR
jgi:hypothetical protein